MNGVDQNGHYRPARLPVVLSTMGIRDFSSVSSMVGCLVIEYVHRNAYVSNDSAHLAVPMNSALLPASSGESGLW
jgi:hypothetical protein